MARGKKQKKVEEGLPAWMGTYGDMITLVLTLFVLLFSFSEIDAKKWEAIKSSFMGVNVNNVQALDPFSIGMPFTVEQDIGKAYKRSEQAPEEEPPEEERDTMVGIDEEGQKEIQEDFEELYEKIKKYIAEEGYDTTVVVKKDGMWITIQMDEIALFNTGDANVKKEAVEILEFIGRMITEHNTAIKSVKVEGHTDNVYINRGVFKSNWELSALRAVNVLKIFVNTTEDQTNRDKFTAIAYGEYHPVASNDTEEGRAKNRRVELTIESKENLLFNLEQVRNEIVDESASVDIDTDEIDISYSLE